jgi:hypothetical protein
MNMSRKVLALSQEKLRFLSCHGQIKGKVALPAKAIPVQRF